uniref:E4 n=1 Tax=Gammapapillomavirus 12 TaxID=1513257 RepID=A0A2D2AMK1_9PAPI|nr:E4 [Gammapapillomavirus 12]
MKQSLLLLIAPTGPFPGLLLKPVGDPPRSPHPNRRHLESGPTKPTKTPIGNRPPRPVLEFDYDDETNKENQPPENNNDLPEEDWGLHHLLKKWEGELDQFRERVLRDLDDCKRRLGIRF